MASVVMGMINLLKPPGPTSHDMVNWIRRLLGIKRVGHLGTLDPGAAGVLPLCVGSATRLSEYMSEWDKQYRAEMLLGIKTDSQDLMGKIIEINQKACQVTEAQIKNVLEQMVGVYEQVPPMVSAVKHQGRRLYQLAREGKIVERKSRTVRIQKLKIQRINYTSFMTMPNCPRVLFDITVSKGTYIRTLCADVGEKLGCGGTMAFLVRTRCGPLTLERAWTCEEIEAAWNRADMSFLLSPQMGISDWPVWVVRPEALIGVENGASLGSECFLNSEVKAVQPGTRGFLQMPGGELVAVGLMKENRQGHLYCQPEKVLVSRNALIR
ncbi:MAG: tRNA pseudouridine(55) synthase TruB [Syntrophomonadaceae bacterium]|nr:tRNA pseudouridine(55) synthase TruB [Syntrophomonadaceae bacterium]